MFSTFYRHLFILFLYLYFQARIGHGSRLLLQKVGDINTNYSQQSGCKDGVHSSEGSSAQSRTASAQSYRDREETQLNQSDIKGGGKQEGSADITDQRGGEGESTDFREGVGANSTELKILAEVENRGKEIEINVQHLGN